MAIPLPVEDPPISLNIYYQYHKTNINSQIKYHISSFDQIHHGGPTKRSRKASVRLGSAHESKVREVITEQGRRSTSVNRIQGKSMLKNKSPQIARDYMSSYVGYLRDKRTIAHAIVERVSNMKCEQRKQLTTT